MGEQLAPGQAMQKWESHRVGRQWVAVGGHGIDRAERFLSPVQLCEGHGQLGQLRSVPGAKVGRGVCRGRHRPLLQDTVWHEGQTL